MTGRILDSSNNPIPYAHISLPGTEIGTVSNDSGFFTLNISKTLFKIKISSIGFEEKFLSNTEMSFDDLNKVYLNFSKISLKEVVVKGTFDSASWYVQQAIKNITKNYSNKKHSQIAFYRESSVRDSIYSRMVEAIVMLSDKGVNSPSEKTQYEVLRLRKTEDNRNIGWRQSLQNWLYQDAGVYAMNKANPFKPTDAEEQDFNEVLVSPSLAKLRKESPTRLLNTGFVEDNVYSIVSQFQIGEEEFIKINFKRADKELIKFFETGGYLIINKDDYAIIEFNRWVKNVKKSSNDDGFRANYLIQYQKSGDLYFPFFIRDMVVGSNASRIFDIADSEQYYSTKGKIGKIYTVNELYILETKDYEKISWRSEMSKDDDMYDIQPTKRLGFTFDNINTIPINPISQKMITDLTQNNSIDALFIEE
ncbi:carboxypeptidase-like regulatory domain-containing protein [Marivirga lumbricoides]|uniref:carboxypeptidase-like regulatory domain-containing protein n=1 Tax=Marivirga lumbricoides TaxID=1046115 RepID=UPI001666FFDC